VARDELLALLRSCLLMKPSLNSDGQVRMEENTLSESYMDAIKLGDGARWTAGGSIQFDMKMRETNFGIQLGTADQITVAESPLT
jgi:hypothetical protein